MQTIKAINNYGWLLLVSACTSNYMHEVSGVSVANLNEDHNLFPRLEKCNAHF